MSRYLLALLCLTGLVQLSGQSAERFVLANGLTVVAYDQRNTRAVHIAVVVDSGPSWEGDHIGSGAANLVRRLVAATASDRRMAMESLGGRLVSRTDVSSTRYGLTTTDSQAGAALAFLAESLAQPELSDERILQEKTLVLQDLAQRSGRASWLQDRSVQQLLFRRHPARYPVEGRADDLKPLTPVEIRDLHKRHYRSGGTTVVVVGNIDAERVKTMVAKAFGTYPNGAAQLQSAINEPTQFAERSDVVEADVDNLQTAYVWRTRSLAYYSEVASLDLSSYILRQELTRTLVTPEEGEPVATWVDVRHVVSPDHPSHMLIECRPSGDEGSAWLGIQRVLKRLASDGPSAKDLEQAKRRWRHDRRLSLARVEGISEDLILWEQAVGVPGFGHRYAIRVADLNADNIREVFAKRLQPKGPNRSKLVIRPKSKDGEGDIREPTPPFSDVPPQVRTIGDVRLLYRYMPTGLVHLRATISGGFSAESETQQGWMNVLARQLRHGSTNRQGPDLENLLQDLGMSFSVHVDAEGLDLEVICFPEQVDQGMLVLLDTLRDPALPSVELEVQQQLAAAQQEAGPIQAMVDRARRILLEGHYAAADHRGTAESLGALNQTSLLEFHRQWVTAGNLVVTSYGETEIGKVQDALAEQLAQVPHLRSDAPEGIPGAPWPETFPSATVSLNSRNGQAALLVAKPAPGLESAANEGAALDVLSALLVGAGEGGDIGKALIQAGLDPVDKINLDTEVYRGRGMWRLTLVTPPERLDEALQLVQQNIAGVVDGLNNGDQARLQAAKALCINRRIIAQENHSAVAAKHARHLLRGENADQDLLYEERINQVTPELLQQVLDRYLLADGVIVKLAPPAPEPPKNQIGQDLAKAIAAFTEAMTKAQETGAEALGPLTQQKAQLQQQVESWINSPEAANLTDEQQDAQLKKWGWDEVNSRYEAVEKELSTP